MNPEKRIAPSAEQMGYELRPGSRFKIGLPDAEPRLNVVVIAVHEDWLEYEVENEHGHLTSPRSSIAVRTLAFRWSIIEELVPREI